MVVQDDFYRFLLKDSFGVICSPLCNVLYDEAEKLAIVGALDEIKVWNLKTGALSCSLLEQTESRRHQVTRLQLSPSNKDLIAAGYEDGSVKLWSLKENRVVVQFNGHRSPVTALCFEPYTGRLASGGRDSDIVIWDLVAECGLVRLQGHTGGITGMCFIRSGQYLISAARDTLVKVWDLEAQVAVETQVCHRNEITDLVTSSDEQILMTVGADQFLRVFSIDHDYLPTVLAADKPAKEEAKRRALVLSGEVQRCTKDRAVQISLHANHKILSILSADRSLELFEIRSKEGAKNKLRRRKKSAAVSLSQDEALLTVPDLFKQLRVCRLSSKAHSFVLSVRKDLKDSIRVLVGYNNNRIEELAIPYLKEQEVSTIGGIDMIGHRSEIRALSVSPDQRLLISGAPDGCKVWSMSESCDYVRSVQAEEISDVSCCAFLPDSQHVLLGTKRGLLVLGNAETGELIEAYKAHGGNLWSLDIGSDGKTIATASSDKTVKFWEYKEKKKRLKCLKTLDLGDEALVVKLSRDLRLMAVATLDLTVKVFFVDSLHIFLTLFGHKLPVTSIDISSDCKTLITGSLDKSVKVWGLSFGELVKSILAHSEAVTGVRFIEDGRAFVSISKDRSVRTWNASGSFQPLQRHFDGRHFGEVWALAVSPSYIITSGQDKGIRRFGRSEYDLLVPQEEAEREAEQRLEENVLESSNTASHSAEPSTLTMESMRASERIVAAIEAADEERMARDEAAASGLPHHTPTVIFSSVARDLSPFEYVMRQIDSVPTPDIEQSIILLPQRLLYSLLLYTEQAMSSPYIVTASATFSTVTRLFFNELCADGQLKGRLAGIRDKMRRNLESLDKLYMFNYAALSL